MFTPYDRHSLFSQSSSYRFDIVGFGFGFFYNKNVIHVAIHFYSTSYERDTL